MAPHPAANRLGLKIRADLARVFRYGERDDPVRRRLPEPFFGRRQEEAGMVSIRHIRNFLRRSLARSGMRSGSPTVFGLR